MTGDVVTRLVRNRMTGSGSDVTSKEQNERKRRCRH